MYHQYYHRCPSLKPEPRFICPHHDGKCCGFGCMDKPAEKRNNFELSRQQHSTVRDSLKEMVSEMRDECDQSDNKENRAIIDEVSFLIKEVCKDYKRYNDPYRCYRQTIPLLKNIYGDNDPRVGDIMVSLALACSQSKMSERGIEILEEALIIFRNALADFENKESRHLSRRDDVNDDQQYRRSSSIMFKIINALNQMGNLYFESGDINLASEKYIEAIQACGAAGRGSNKSKGEGQYLPRDSCLSIHLAEIINNIASTEARKHRFGNSIDTFHQALNLQIDLFGEDDPAVAMTINNIGTMNFHAGQYQNALKAFKQVVFMRKEIFGLGDQSVADALLNVGIVQLKLREYEKAEKAVECALRITNDMMDTLDTPHLKDTATAKAAEIHSIWGAILRKKGDAAGAVDQFETSRELYESVGITMPHENNQIRS